MEYRPVQREYSKIPLVDSSLRHHWLDVECTATRLAREDVIYLATTAICYYLPIVGGMFTRTLSKDEMLTNFASDWHMSGR